MATLRINSVSFFSDRWPRRGRSYGIVLWDVNSSHPVLQTLLRQFYSIPIMRVARWTKTWYLTIFDICPHRSLLGVGVMRLCFGYLTVLIQFSKLYFEIFFQFRLWGLPDEKKTWFLTIFDICPHKSLLVLQIAPKLDELFSDISWIVYATFCAGDFLFEIWPIRITWSTNQGQRSKT